MKQRFIIKMPPLAASESLKLDGEKEISQHVPWQINFMLVWTENRKERLQKQVLLITLKSVSGT